ncbi:TPA: LamG domain-containing protein, partial [Candidatus Poribacteria bacterium]|nr:LamG domain-containing protein [Candidatus Poribacteria bacterium]
ITRTKVILNMFFDIVNFLSCNLIESNQTMCSIPLLIKCILAQQLIIVKYLGTIALARLDGALSVEAIVEGDLKSVAGQIGEALQFDGNSDNYVLIKDAKTFDFNADFTWMAWVKTGNSGPGCIFAKTGARGGDDQGPKTWWIVNSVQSFDTGWVGNVEDTEAISDNKWHHLAIAATAKDSSIQYYVDGEATGGGSIAFASKPDEWEETFVQIGIDGRVDGELGFFEGAIDEVGIYDRVLSGAEVKQNSKSVAGPAVAVADPSGKLAVTWGKIKMSQ